MPREFKGPVIVSSRLLGRITRMDPAFWAFMQYHAAKTMTTLDDGSFDFVLTAAENDIIRVHREARYLRQQAKFLVESARSLEAQFPKDMLTPAGRKRLYKELHTDEDDLDG